MMGWIVKLVVGVVLFAGSLVGGLALTGRLNHEGTANIPLLNALFPPPPAPPAGEAAPDGARGEAHGTPQDANASPAGETVPAAADATHGQAQEPGEQAPRRRKTGRSLVVSEEAAPEPHGAEPKDAAGADPHGKEAAGNEEHGKQEPATGEHGNDGPGDGATAHGGAGSSAEGDFQRLEDFLAGGKSQYRPGELFRFQGLPAGISADQINEAWQRVQGLMAEIERRKVVLDQQEQQLRELGEDVGRRQAALGKERVEIEQMHRQLDAKIQKFQQQVKMVRTDEVAAHKRNAQTLASFEAAKAAELVAAQWKTDKGQDEVLKLLEFMDKDAANEILGLLPEPTLNDLLQKRLRVTKEPAPSGKGN